MKVIQIERSVDFMKRTTLLISIIVIIVLLVGCKQNKTINNESKEDKEVEWIEKAGGSILSKNIIEEKGVLTWMFREESMNPQDNGWRFLSDIDDQEYIDNPDNLVVWDFNQIAEIEPAIVALYDYPVGTDIQIIREDGEIKFYDNIKEDWIELDDEN